MFLDNGNMKHLKNHLTELVSQSVIDTPTALRISAYYDKQKSDTGNRILMAFGVLAACLIGLGILLIIGHNWDNLGRGIKTIMAFLPLLIAQGLCYYTLRQKANSSVWRESCSVLLFFGIGACMAMVSQIYNLQGSLSNFLLTWMSLSLPIIYLLRSRVVAHFYFIGVASALPILGMRSTWIIGINAYPWLYLIMFSLGIPFYLQQLKSHKKINSTVLLHWTIALSFLYLIMKNLASDIESISLTIMLLMGTYLGIGRLPFFKNQKLRVNAYAIIGSVATLITLFIASFQDYWNFLYRAHSWDTVQTNFLGIAALALLIWNLIMKNISPKSILPYAFLVYFVIFRDFNVLGTIAINLLLLGIGIEYLRKGHRTNRLTFYNYGLGIISITTISRFLETDLSYLGKGLCFVGLGLLFFSTNYYLIKRKDNEQLTH